MTSRAAGTNADTTTTTTIERTSVAPRLQFWVLLGTGLFSLVSGGSLAISGEPVATNIGAALLMAVPSCFYFAWRGRPQAVRVRR